MLIGDAAPIALRLPLTEADRLAFGTVVRDAWLAGAGDVEKLEGTLAGAQPCVSSAFRAGGRDFTLSGGAAPAPIRWAISSDERMLFLLLPVPQGRGDGAKAAKSVLFSLARGQVFVIQAYDGLPGEQRMVADATASFAKDFAPLAMIEGHGDAVDVFRATASGLGAQIFAKANRPYPVSFNLVDGHFFVPDARFDARMRGSGMPCPRDLGEVKLKSRLLDLGDDADLDLGCQYVDSAGTRVTVFATLTSEPLERVFSTEEAHYRQPEDDTRTVDLPWVSAGPGRFARAKAWRYAGGEGYVRAHWAGMRGRYLIQVHAIWNPEDEKAVRVAEGILERLAFEETPSDR